MGYRADELADVGFVVGAAGEDVRRSVGPTAWCVLEVLATMPPSHADDGWIVRSSVRELATRLGVSKNTAQRALVMLRSAGLVDFAQQRDGGGRFGESSYHLSIPGDVIVRNRPRAPARSRRSRRAGPVASRRSSPAQLPVRGLVEQLVLLPGR